MEIAFRPVSAARARGIVAGRAKPIYGGPIHSGQLQSAHRAFARAELIGIDAHALEHRYEKPRERVVVLRVEGEVLAVLEAAASK